MTSFRVQPGNPELAASLRDEREANAHAERVRKERGLPDEVLDRILEDMFLIGCRVDGWSKEHRRHAGLRDDEAAA